VTIRRATIEDAERIAALSGTLGYPVDPAAIRDRLTRLLASPTDIVLVATMPEVVGWLHGTDHEFLETGRCCEIVGLVVDGSCRGQGTGRHLVAGVESWAAERGLDRVIVRSNVLRAESHPFYERIGYRRIKTQHVYRKSIGDAPQCSDSE
jgi:N-acetylglutamate synthase-like GNAT family acetyltransferase